MDFRFDAGAHGLYPRFRLKRKWRHGRNRHRRTAPRLSWPLFQTAVVRKAQTGGYARCRALARSGLIDARHFRARGKIGTVRDTRHVWEPVKSSRYTASSRKAGMQPGFAAWAARMPDFMKGFEPLAS